MATYRTGIGQAWMPSGEGRQSTLKSGTYWEEKVLDAVTADMTLVEALFSGPALEDPEAATDASRDAPKPQGTSDQGYRED